jgi:inorganic pyrophosphatase
LHGSDATVIRSPRHRRHGVGMSIHDPATLPLHKDGQVVVVIETPSRSGNKLKFDPELKEFRLERVLPAGMAFPCEFGFFPGTVADDGDPLDAIVLMDSPMAPGTIVLGRLIGILKVEQQDGGKGPWVRNDRVVAVPDGPKGHSAVRSLDDVDPFRLEAIGNFFVAYHALDGDRLRVTGQGGVHAAEAAIAKAVKAREASGAGSGAGQAP